MSCIDHRCPQCGHIGLTHSASGCWCGCPATGVTGPSELVATYTAGRTPIEAITPPGQRALLSISCSCQDCRDLYARLTGGPA